MLFNNREIAVACWLGVLLLFSLAHPSVRRSLYRVLEALLHWKIALALMLMGLYTAVGVWRLRAAGLWTDALLKDTIVWFLFSGIALLFDFVTNKEKEGILRRAFLNNLKVTVLLEFLVATYTFSIPLELVLLPCVALLAIVGVVAKREPQYASAAKLATGLQVTVGLAVLISAVVKATRHFSVIGNLDSVRQLLLPPVLSVMLAPFVYLFGLYAAYELLFLRLGVGADIPQPVRLYARWRLALHLRLSVRRVNAFMRAYGGELIAVRTKADIDRLVTTAPDKAIRRS